mgnify:CR=1 FL=1
MADAPHPTTAPQAGPGRRLAAPAAPAHRPPAPNPYDELPYDSHPFSQTHPARLATVATLFDLAPAPVETCRVLELGCAAGGNIATIGEMFPGAEIVGVDLSARQIADGERVVRKAGLANVSLRHASITDIDAGYGTFDYVVCHGVFSWVPDPVRRKILAVCSANLKPSGVAYVSYNTYPGWHMRGMLRDMMRFHADRFGDAKQKVEQARALIDFLASSTKNDTGPYGTLLRQELESLRHQADHYLYHEHLEEVNDPVYFHQFAEKAKAHGLKYLGEARVQTMVTGNFGPEIDKTLRMLAPDQTQIEQYMDFLRNRMFRESLLCLERVTPNWAVQPDCLRVMHIASGAVPVGGDGKPLPTVDVTAADNVSYKAPGGMSMATNRPLLKAAMRLLQQAYPGTVPFDTLRVQARELIGGSVDAKTVAEDTQVLAIGLLNCYMGSDLIELHGMPVTLFRTPGDKPTATGHARVTAARSGTVANKRHEIVKLNDLDKQLIPLLDGTNDRAALVEKLTAVAQTGTLNVQRDGMTLYAPDEIKAALASVIDPALANVARMGVLVA